MREKHYTWEWQLQASPAQLWPLVADTNRFDRDAGVPGVARLDRGEQLENTRVRLRVKQFGIPLDYVQEPFEWDEPRRFSVTRRFTTGPLASLRILAELEPTPAGGTTLIYNVWAAARNPIFAPAIPIQIGTVLARTFDRTFRSYDRIAVVGDLSATSGGRVRLAPGGAARLVEQRRTLVDASVRPSVVDHLVGIVESGDDLAVGRLRPFALAARWGESRRETLEAFLLATRSGLLQFRWDVLCPMCRIAKASPQSLSALPSTVHCDTCNVEYGADFARSVELTFTPNPSIRVVDRNEYCVGNPAATPHIVSQRLVAAGETSSFGPLQEEGRYRVRCFEVSGATYVRVGHLGLSALSITTDAIGEGTDPDDGNDPEVAVGGTIEVHNDLRTEQLVLLERTSIGDDAVTAAMVTSTQRFRDLFADEALRPGDQVSVGSLAIAFTDLTDSTRLYQTIGDAVAFGRVLDHFDVLRTCIAEEDGGVVKTIGDAVMAVFPTPVAAVRAVIAARQRIAENADQHDHPLSLKIGVHFGPCIGVRLNDQLDYFGSTVNLAARVQGRAGPNEIVLSSQVRDDPEVRALLADMGDDANLDEIIASLKGFDDEFTLWRLGARP